MLSKIGEVKVKSKQITFQFTDKVKILQDGGDHVG